MSNQIIFIISDLGSGGAQRVIVGLSNYWVNQNRQVKILVLDNSINFYPIDERVQVVCRKKNLSQFSFFILLLKPFSNLNRILFLHSHLKQVNNALFISFIDRTNILSLIANIGLNRKLVISERGNMCFYQQPLIWENARKLLYNRATAIVAQTKGIVKDLLQLGISAHKMHVIPNPLCIDANSNSELIKESIILAVGRLHKDKQFDLLIDAYASSNVMWPLYIIGEGEERSFLESRIRSLSLNDRVFLLGNNSELKRFYARASIFILSSRTEGFPNVLLEAMSFGCACISTNCDYGPSEIINSGIDGILVDNGIHSAMANAIKNLVKDNQLVSFLGSNARKRVKAFDIERIAQKWLEIASDD